MHTYTIELNSEILRLSESQILNLADSQTAKHFISMHTYTIELDSQILRLSESQILRLSDSQSLRLSDSLQALELSLHQTLRFLDSLTLRLSDSHKLRLTGPQTPSKLAYVQSWVGLSDYQALRIPDSQIHRFSDTLILSACQTV